MSSPMNAQAQPDTLLRRLGAALRQWRTHKGAAAATFAVAIVAFLGMAALAIDVGFWYLELRRARNAADAGAMAGVAVMSRYSAATNDPYVGAPQGIGAARETAAGNGFSQGDGVTVTINHPPVSGAYAGNPWAMEVIISARQASRLSRVVNASGSPMLGVRAVAAVEDLGPACMLALGGDGLRIGGSAVTATQACVLASNATGDDSIRFYGSANITAETVVASGECSGCDLATLSTPYRSYAPPTSNPFASLNNKAMPTTMDCFPQPRFSGGGGQPTQTWQPSIPAGGGGSGSLHGYCGDTTLSNGQTLNLQAGVYYFWNSGLRLSGGTIRCSNCGAPGTNGVTLVFTGSDPNRIGTLRMDGTGTVDLYASPVQPDPDYNGILFYRDVRATNDNGPFATTINGGSTIKLSGGMYFPSSTISYSGNMASTQPCTTVVGMSIVLSGSSTTTLDNTNCSIYGTMQARTRVVRLVE